MITGEYRGDDEYPLKPAALRNIERKSMVEGWKEPSEEQKEAMVNRQIRIAIDPASNDRNARLAFVALTNVSRWKDEQSNPTSHIIQPVVIIPPTGSLEEQQRRLTNGMDSNNGS